MAVNLVKGQKINLVKESPSMRHVRVGLGWDEAERKKGLFASLFGGKTADIDCDASVILCGADGKAVSRTIAECCVYFGNLEHPSGAIRHAGDNLTGGGEGDDEQIEVDLTKVPANIERIAFTVTIYDADRKRQNFGQVSNAFIRIVDEVTGQEIIRYDLGEDFSIETAIVVGELYRRGEEWKFNAIGSGYQGAPAQTAEPQYEQPPFMEPPVQSIQPVSDPAASDEGFMDIQDSLEDEGLPFE